MDSEEYPAIFVIDLQHANKNNFFYKFFCLLILDKKSKRSNKTVTVGMKALLHIFA
jgi:hypothetical protein